MKEMRLQDGILTKPDGTKKRFKRSISADGTIYWTFEK